MEETTKPAAFQHLSIPATDIAVAQEFYGRVFGWTFSPHGNDYVLFDDGGYGGGLTATPPGGVDAILPYLLVTDIQATLTLVAAAGGKVLVGPEAVDGDSGSTAVFADPHGNRIGLYRPG